MKTDIPDKTVVKYRHRGEWEFARVCLLRPDQQNGDDKYRLMAFGELPGDRHMTDDERKGAVRCVWKDCGMTLVKGK